MGCVLHTQNVLQLYLEKKKKERSSPGTTTCTAKPTLEFPLKVKRRQLIF